MYFSRNPIYQCLESVHSTFNFRNVHIVDCGGGEFCIYGIWRDDGPDRGEKWLSDVPDAFRMNVRTIGKWTLHGWLWNRVENFRKQLLAGR